MDNPHEKIFLALETALDGGSVSILKRGKQIDWAVGAGELSKSEDVLPLIENLLKKNGIDKREIGLIAVSDGPGSLTGLRIGLAIALGLGDSLSVKVYKMSVLEAMTYRINLEGLEGRGLSALCSKRSGVFYREFLIKDGQCAAFGEIAQTSKLSEFVDKLESLKEENVAVILDESLQQLIVNEGAFFKGVSFFPVKGNMAEIIGMAVMAKTSWKALL